MFASNERKGEIWRNSPSRRRLIIGTRRRETTTNKLSAHRRPQATNLANRSVNTTTTKRHSLIQRANGRSSYTDDAAAESGRRSIFRRAFATKAATTTIAFSAAFSATSEPSHVAHGRQSVLVSVRRCFIATLSFTHWSCRSQVAYNRRWCFKRWIQWAAAV